MLVCRTLTREMPSFNPGLLCSSGMEMTDKKIPKTTTINKHDEFNEFLKTCYLQSILIKSVCRASLRNMVRSPGTMYI